MKILTLKLNKWYGGISDDVREQNPDVFAISYHFDIFSSPVKMSPYRSQITNDTVASTSSTMTEFYTRNFTVSPDTGYIYAYGRISQASDKGRILVKTDPVGNGSTWAISASSSQSANGTPYRNTFMPYKSYLYGIKGAGSGTTNKLDLWRYGSLTTGAKLLTEPFGGADLLDSGGNAVTAQGIVGKDDCLYLPYANKLAKVDTGATATAAALTLPSEYSITSLAPYQNYLAIACKPKTTGSGLSSKVFIWDYVSDDVSDVIDFGEGDLLVLENLDGNLFGISSIATTSAYNISTKTVITQYSGGFATVVEEIPYTGLLQMKEKKGNKLYFVLSDGTTLGIWVYGRKSSKYEYTYTLDRLINGSTAVTTLNAFKFLGDYMFSSMGSSGNIMRTTDQTTYGYTAIYHSQKFNSNNLQKDKTLRYINLLHTPLTSGTSLVVKYRINSDTSWTSLMTSSTEGATSKDATNQENNGNKAFPSFKEIQFRIEATGLAEPIELMCQYIEDESLLIEPQSE